jgi:hypothetical protein
LGFHGLALGGSVSVVRKGIRWFEKASR